MIGKKRPPPQEKGSGDRSVKFRADGPIVLQIGSVDTVYFHGCIAPVV